MGKEAAVEQLQRIMKDEVHSEYFDDLGTFLPEGVLAKQGYDMDFIKARIAPDDVKEDRVLGTCYRIRLETTGNSGSRNITFSDGMRAAAKAVRGRKRKAIMDGSVGDMNDSSQHLAIEDGSVGGSDRNTASSSSSADNSSDSSSSDKKNSKKKRTRSGRTRSERTRKRRTRSERRRTRTRRTRTRGVTSRKAERSSGPGRPWPRPRRRRNKG
jgi:hypothetical protein